MLPRLLALGLFTLAGCHCCKRVQHGDEARAGYPRDVSVCAQPSDTGRYIGYQVGGGAACGGHGRGRDDGTWGWDYAGLCLPARVALGWWHGRKHQGGAGAYRVDGPRPLEECREKKESEHCGPSCSTPGEGS